MWTSSSGQPRLEQFMSEMETHITDRISTSLFMTSRQSGKQYLGPLEDRESWLVMAIQTQAFGNSIVWWSIIHLENIQELVYNYFHYIIYFSSECSLDSGAKKRPKFRLMSAKLQGSRINHYVSIRIIFITSVGATSNLRIPFSWLTIRHPSFYIPPCCAAVGVDTNMGLFKGTISQCFITCSLLAVSSHEHYIRVIPCQINQYSGKLKSWCLRFSLNFNHIYNSHIWPALQNC